MSGVRVPDRALENAVFGTKGTGDGILFAHKRHFACLRRGEITETYDSKKTPQKMSVDIFLRSFFCFSVLNENSCGFPLELQDRCEADADGAADGYGDGDFDEVENHERKDAGFECCGEGHASHDG